MKKRIYLSICLASLITLLLTVIFAAGVMYRNMSAEVRGAVRNEALFMSAAMNRLDSEADVMDYASYSGKHSENRITLIAADGAVMYDNYADIKTMDNHISRPEIAAALEKGTGEMTRSSETVGSQTYYYAVRLDDGTVLRIAVTTKNVPGLLGLSAPWIAGIIIVVILISLLTAGMLTNSVVEPINRLDLDEPASNVTYDELSPLLVRLDKQNSRIRSQMEELSEQQKEFEYITENMSEGLVIFGSSGRIITANNSAKLILGNDNASMYSELCRDEEYLHAVEGSLSGERIKSKLIKGERVYELSADPVDNSQKHGAVLFIMDVTESENSEKLRREFSANVSHELKTPLTSIMGAAEIIENGIVKPEDIPHFAGQIHKEASRLLTLIQDIIKLSRLDENSIETEFEAVDLKELCLDVMAELEGKASDKNVTVEFEGTAVTINGVRPVLHEMIFNLCDNAIAYNKEGGSVKLSLTDAEGTKKLTVSDTGIGIAPEHRARVFERFYRVDKSHSKATGGTGLGLSIVKHGAQLHGGRVSLDSKVGVGTKIEITF